MPQQTKRPEFIRHYSEIQLEDNRHYPGSDELHSIGSPFAKVMGLTSLGIHHELFPPRCRTSWPHAESDEEEFIYVLEGEPDVWVDGELYRLKPGDCVAFPDGTGITHTFLNNSDKDVRLLVIDEASKPTNQLYYPKHPIRKEQLGDRWWRDVPEKTLGPHDGLPDGVEEG